MKRSAIRRGLRRLFVVPLLLLIGSGQASAIAPLVAGIVIFLVALFMRTAFVSKYALMVLILLNPCVRAPCPSYTVAGLTMPSPRADEAVMALNRDMLTMFHEFYVVMILYYAVYVIFMSTSPSARSKGKNMLMNLLVGMIVVSQSRVILQLALNISQAVAYSIIDIAGQRLAELGSLGLMARAEMCILDLVFVSLGMAAMMAAGLRYFMILLMAAFFPLALFLYFIPFTKNYGIVLIRFTMLLIFIQVIQAMLYSVTIISAVDETGLPGFIIAIGGLFGVVYSPLLGMKLMGWLGAATHFYSTRAGGAATRFVSMLMRGQSVGTAFQTAGAQYMISHNMGPMVRGLAASPFGASTPVPSAWGARAPTGYGIRSARSFGGISEGHMGVGRRLPAEPLGGGVPDGGYIYQKTPEAIGGSTISQKIQMERERGFERITPRTEVLTPPAMAHRMRGIEASAGAARPRTAWAAFGQTVGGAGGVIPPAKGGLITPAERAPSYGAPPAAPKTPTAGLLTGRTRAITPAEATAAAAAGEYTTETQERKAEKEGQLRVGEPGEVTQKPAGVGVGKQAGIDEEKHKKEMDHLRAKREELLRQRKKQEGEPASSTGEMQGLPRKTLQRDLDRREIEEKARLPEKTRGEVKEGIFEEKMPETAREPMLAEPRPSDVRTLYEELDRKLRSLKEVGHEVGEPDEMLREAFSLIGDMKYDDAYRKLENVRRMLGT